MTIGANNFKSKLTKIVALIAMVILGITAFRYIDFAETFKPTPQVRNPIDIESIQ